MKFDVNVKDYAQDFFNKEDEEKKAEIFKFYPVEPITVEKVEGEMVDDFNGMLKITFSNGDEIRYVIRERRTPLEPGEAPPYYEVVVELNDREIMWKDFMEYIAQYGGTTHALLEVYREWTVDELS